MKVKSAAETAAKWARVTPGRQKDYEDGVKDPSVDWQRATEGSAQAYEAGIAESLQRGSFQKGVNAAGNARWQQKTANVGAARWGPGVREAQADHEAGITPFIQALERVQLPPRGPRGDARNLERVAVVARALTEARKR